MARAGEPIAGHVDHTTQMWAHQADGTDIPGQSWMMIAWAVGYGVREPIG